MGFLRNRTGSPLVTIGGPVPSQDFIPEASPELADNGHFTRVLKLASWSVIAVLTGSGNSLQIRPELDRAVLTEGAFQTGDPTALS